MNWDIDIDADLIAALIDIEKPKKGLKETTCKCCGKKHKQKK